MLTVLADWWQGTITEILKINEASDRQKHIISKSLNTFRFDVHSDMLSVIPSPEVACLTMWDKTVLWD